MERALVGFGAVEVAGKDLGPAREQLAGGDVAAVRSVASMLEELEAIWRGRIDRIDALLSDALLSDARPDEAPSRESRDTTPQED